MYELLTGVRPFEGTNVTAIAIAHVEREAEPPSTHLPGLSPEIDALVMRCLRKAPEARFRDGNELSRAIDGLETEEPDATELMPPAEPAALPRRSYRRLALVAAVLLAITSFAVVRGLVGEGTHERAKAETETGGSVREKGGRGSHEENEPAETTDLPTPTESAAPSEDGEGSTAEDASGVDENEGEEPEPEPTPTVSDTPAPEPTPTPDVETPPDAGGSDA